MTYVFPVGAQVLVAWPGFPVFVSRVLAASRDCQGRPLYFVRDECAEQSWWVMEKVLTDLAPFGRPACAIVTEGGRA
jgi:hypothetical protein